MKNTLIKTIGITVGVCATLWFAPASAEATEDGNTLQLDANLLNEKEGKATILDIQLDNIPLVGDLQVKIPSKSTEETTEKSAALATVKIAGGDLVEDLNVSVLEENKSDQATDEQKKSSLASVELATPLTEEVNVEVLSSDQKSSSDTKSFDGGVVEVNAPNLPIVGETHVGVLDKHTAENGENSSHSAGLVQADLDGDLLKDTSVTVLASENSSSEEGSDKTASLVSAKVDEESLGGLVEDLNVSVLEGIHSETATTKHEKGSLASVGLKTPLTEEVNVDVLLADRQNDSVSSSFDGGLVEVNAPNLPIVGETHVGVLDKHTAENGENSSYSAGLVQVGLDGDLLKDTSVTVLAENKFSNADGTIIKNDGVSIQLGTDTIGPLKVDILSKEQFYPNTNVVEPSPDAGGDDSTPTPPSVIVPTPGDKDDTTGNDNNPGTDNPGIVNPGPGNGDDEGTVKPGPGNGDDQGAVNPDIDNGVNAPIPDANDSIDGVGSTNPNANTENSFVDEIVSNTVGSDNFADLSGALGLVTHSNDKKQGNGTGTNMATSLPKTGGLLDGTLLLLLSLLLLVSGVGLRRAVS